MKTYGKPEFMNDPKVHFVKDESGNVIGIALDDDKLLVRGSFSVPAPNNPYYIRPSRWQRFKRWVRGLRMHDNHIRR